MNKEHSQRLEDIAACCNKDAEGLKDLYLWKTVCYRYQNLERAMTTDESHYENRAMEAIQGYATRVWNYRESWIE